MIGMLKPMAMCLLAMLLTGTSADKVTIYLAGDSTMSMKAVSAYPETGWGMPFSIMFDSSVVVENHAMNGRSTRTFISENRWQIIADRLEPGDFVMIQFGHNDESKEKTDRYTSPEDYKKNLTKFITESRLKSQANTDHAGSAQKIQGRKNSGNSSRVFPAGI
jgi:lysophospholipase L1-like esterase